MTSAITDQSFQTEVLESDKPVLVDFWAEWCGPCRQVGPVLEQISQEQDDIKIVKLNVDENPDATRNYQVMSIPTMLVFKDGEIVKTLVGAKTKSMLVKELAEV